MLVNEPWEGGLRVSGKPRPSGGDPLPPEGVPRALCPGEGAVLPAAAPWPTAGHPSAWEFLELGPAGAGRAQSWVQRQTVGSVLVTNACLGDQRDGISDAWEEAGDLG